MDPRRMCPHCRAFITNKDKVCPYCNERVGERAIERRDPTPLLGGLIPNAGFTTFIILFINFGIYVASSIMSMRSGNGNFINLDGETLFELGAKYNAALAAGQWWRLVTAGFLHGGILHIFFNSYALLDIGSQVEEAFGVSRMLVIYFVSTVLGFYASAMWSASLSVGASAALFGLIGAMLALTIREHRRFGAYRGYYVRWAIYGVVYAILPGLHIDNAAHFGGFVAGFAIGFVAGTPKLINSWTETLWRTGSWICILLTAVSFLKMYLWLTRPGA
jgi:rhomboid protease GluP